MPRTPLSAEDLATYRERLMARAREVRENLRTIADETDPTEHVTAVTNHPAEGAADSERQFLAALSAQPENDELALIDRALRKIDDGEPTAYGICEYSGEPIERRRLDLIPWTPYSVASLNEMERLRVDPTDALLPV